jgi:hypothetical protein
MQLQVVASKVSILRHEIYPYYPFVNVHENLKPLMDSNDIIAKFVDDVRL